MRSLQSLSLLQPSTKRGRPVPVVLLVSVPLELSLSSQPRVLGCLPSCPPSRCLLSIDISISPESRCYLSPQYISLTPSSRPFGTASATILTLYQSCFHKKCLYCFMNSYINVLYISGSVSVGGNTSISSQL